MDYQEKSIDEKVHKESREGVARIGIVPNKDLYLYTSTCSRYTTKLVCRKGMVKARFSKKSDMPVDTETKTFSI